MKAAYGKSGGARAENHSNEKTRPRKKSVWAEYDNSSHSRPSNHTQISMIRPDKGDYLFARLSPGAAAPVILSLWSLFFSYSGLGLFSSLVGRVQLLILVFFDSLFISPLESKSCFLFIWTLPERVFQSPKTILFIKDSSLLEK